MKIIISDCAIVFHEHLLIRGAGVQLVSILRGGGGTGRSRGATSFYTKRGRGYREEQGCN